MKKLTLRKRLKRHDSMVAPPTNSLHMSDMPESPSSKLENTGTLGKEKLYLTVLKIFFLVIVALVNDRTVVSVSMSAFSLFFLEHVVKYFYRLFKYLFVSQTMKKTTSFSSNEGDTSASDSVVSDCSSLNLSSEEMQDVQAQFESDIRVSEYANFDLDKRSSFGGIDTSKSVLENDESRRGEGSSTKRRGSRKEKVKSKLKKLVPKKLRSMKKRSGSKCEDTGSVDEFKEYETGCSDGKEDNSVAPPDSYQPMRSDSEESVVEAKPQRPTDRRTLVLDYWFVSFIVLAGLVEGQSLAIVLTVAWCLIMKLVARMRRKK